MVDNEREPGRSGPNHVYEFRGEEAASIAVIEAVAESTGQSALEMEPLTEAIDPDALDKLHARESEAASPVTVTFEYCGRDVTVTSSEVHVDQ